MEHRIRQVIAGSIAQELEICPGDYLICINGKPIEDILDYHFLCTSEALTLQIRTADGEEFEAEIEKEEDEDLGLVFEDPFMSAYQHCQNHCIFCFIDQLPKGLRSSLYFKDDDSRLSFLNGNYITLTNMKDSDIDRILRYHLSPMNVSIHTTDPALRRMMLHHPRAGAVLEPLQRFIQSGITVNGQIVLCRGINDGEALERTLSDLLPLSPGLQSLSIVPVGLTRYREGLYPLEPFTRDDARKLIEQVRIWRQRYTEACGLHVVHLADEFYLLAGQELPSQEEYDGFPQIENGVGMMRLFLDEAMQAIEELPSVSLSGKLTIATGTAAAPFLQNILDRFNQKTGAQAAVCAIRNDFFGHSITVSGLLTGQDLLHQLQETDCGKAVLLPENCLRADENVFLDDMRPEELERALQTPVSIVKSSGADLIGRMFRILHT